MSIEPIFVDVLIVVTGLVFLFVGWRMQKKWYRGSGFLGFGFPIGFLGALRMLIRIWPMDIWQQGILFLLAIWCGIRLWDRLRFPVYKL